MNGTKNIIPSPGDPARTPLVLEFLDTGSASSTNVSVMSVTALLSH
jgi:hypothetical protein